MSAILTDSSCPDSILSEGIQEQIVSGIAQDELCVIPGFIPLPHCLQLKAEALRYWRNGAFRQAGISKGQGYALNPGIRSDQIMWLDPDISSEYLRGYLDIINCLKTVINRQLYLNLTGFEGHLAHYPRGAYYRRHLDQFQQDGSRAVTIILYLNTNWKVGDGGQLRIYTGESEDNYMDIFPLAGLLVAFMSSRFEHEVMPATRDRLSMTGWYKQRSTKGFR
jgi:SM-20-related protein